MFTNDYKKIADLLFYFIKEETTKVGMNKIILGLSGGIDSAVCAFLAERALGKENVHTFLMPYKSSSQASLSDAMAVVDATGINYRKIEITPMVDAYFDTYENEKSGLRAGNVMARTRMIVLYDQSAKIGGLVLGTGNKTEILLGYSTLYGDSACAMNPLADLYKTEVFELAKYLGVPKSIIDKKPSADLWEGQNDEDELGIGSYRLADEILVHYFEKKMKINDIVNVGYAEEQVKLVVSLYEKSSFKRRPSIWAKLTPFTPTQEINLLRDWSR